MGKPVVHWELWSKDPENVSNFYAKIFDWKIQHLPETNYRTVETSGAGGINGGIMKPQHEGPWPGNMTFYVDVDDLAAYRKKIVAAGGKIMVDDARHWPSSTRTRHRRAGTCLGFVLRQSLQLRLTHVTLDESVGAQARSRRPSVVRRRALRPQC